MISSRLRLVLPSPLDPLMQNALTDMCSVSSTVGRELALAGDYLM
jgi:hypothetical protein